MPEFPGRAKWDLLLRRRSKGAWEPCWEAACGDVARPPPSCRSEPRQEPRPGAIHSSPARRARGEPDAAGPWAEAAAGDRSQRTRHRGPCFLQWSGAKHAGGLIHTCQRLPHRIKMQVTHLAGDGTPSAQTAAPSRARWPPTGDFLLRKRLAGPLPCSSFLVRGRSRASAYEPRSVYSTQQSLRRQSERHLVMQDRRSFASDR